MFWQKCRDQTSQNHPTIQCTVTRISHQKDNFFAIQPSHALEKKSKNLTRIQQFLYLEKESKIPMNYQNFFLSDSEPYYNICIENEKKRVQGQLKKGQKRKNSSSPVLLWWSTPHRAHSANTPFLGRNDQNFTLACSKGHYFLVDMQQA